MWLRAVKGRMGLRVVSPGTISTGLISCIVFQRFEEGKGDDGGNELEVRSQLGSGSGCGTAWVNGKVTGSGKGSGSGCGRGCDSGSVDEDGKGEEGADLFLLNFLSISVSISFFSSLPKFIPDPFSFCSSSSISRIIFIKNFFRNFKLGIET